MKDKPKLLLILAVVLSVAIALITSATWGFAIITVVLLALLLPLPGPVLSSALARLCVSVMAVLTIYQIESVIFQLLHIHVNASIYILLTLASIIVLWLLARKRGVVDKLTFSRFDIILLLPAIIITGLYVGRVIAPAGDNTVAIIRSITLASDDASHLSMFDTLLRTDSNLVSFTDSGKNSTMQQAGYPMGWHLASSVVALSISPGLKDKTLLTVAVVYFIAKMTSFFLIIIAFTIFIYQLAVQLFTVKSKSLLTHLSLYLLIAFSVFFVALPQSFEGFFSFFPILIYVCLFAAIAVALSHTKTTKKNNLLPILLVLWGIGSAFCWILTAPVLLLSFAIIVLSRYRKLRKIPRWYYAGAGAIVLAFTYQIVALLYVNSESFNVISSPGGITVPDFAVFVLTNIVLFGALYLKRLQPLAQPLLTIIIPLYCLMAPILGYISLKSQEITYYFQKLEVVALAILLPFAGLVFYVIITRLKLLPQRPLNSLYHLLIYAVLLCMIVPSVIGYTYFVNIVSRTHGYRLENQDAQVLVSHVLNHRFNQLNDRVVFYYPESQPRNILGSNIARIGFHNSPCDSKLASDAGYGPFDEFVNDIKTCISTTPPIVIYTDPAGKKALLQSLNHTLLDSGEVKIQLTSD